MEQAIRYYSRKLDNANDLTGIAFTHKLIQLEHQATIEKALNGLKNVQYPRHFPNHLVVQLARLNRPEINECLIDYFEQNFTANNTRWQAMGSLQDERVVQIVINAVQEYGKSYYSRKIVERHIQLLGQIGGQLAFEALHDIIENYFKSDNRFIDNYEIPLASLALDALANIDHPGAQTYRQEAQTIYQQGIEAELADYPARFDKERTSIGIQLHEGSALSRMKQYALPTMIDWHKNHHSQQIRDFALNTLFSTLKAQAEQSDKFTRPAIQYLMSIYDELLERGLIEDCLKILKNSKDEGATNFAWRVFDEGIADTAALNVMQQHNPDAVFEGVSYHYKHYLNLYDMRQENALLIQAYINYFGQVSLGVAEDILINLYNANIPQHERYIAEALIPHASRSETALNFLDYIIQNNQDAITIKQTINALALPEDRTLLILLSLLHCDTVRRNNAIEALGALRDPLAIPHLLEMLLQAQNDSTLADVTIRALERIGTEAAFEALNTWEDNTED